MKNTKTEDLIEEMATQMKQRYSECNGSYTPSELYEEIIKILKSLTTKIHQDYEREAEEKKETPQHHDCCVYHDFPDRCDCTQKKESVAFNQALTHIATYARENIKRLNK